MYKAFNWGTGEAVAVKQIKIADLPRSELRNIEVCSEVMGHGTELTLAGRNRFTKEPECKSLFTASFVPMGGKGHTSTNSLSMIIL